MILPEAVTSKRKELEYAVKRAIQAIDEALNETRKTYLKTQDVIGAFQIVRFRAEEAKEELTSILSPLAAVYKIDQQLRTRSDRDIARDFIKHADATELVTTIKQCVETLHDKLVDAEKTIEEME
jgi:hypothetical protein